MHTQRRTSWRGLLLLTLLTRPSPILSSRDLLDDPPRRTPVDDLATLPEARARPEVVAGQEAVGFQATPVDYTRVVHTVAFGSCSKPEDPQVSGRLHVSDMMAYRDLSSVIPCSFDQHSPLRVCVSFDAPPKTRASCVGV
jgi:hypothetical protein